MRFHFCPAVALAPLSLVLALALPCVATAQELTGTYVRYCDVGDTGSFVNGARSLAYGETVGSSACDIFAQGAFIEGYAIAGTAGASTLAVNVSDDMSTAVTSSLATVSGRTINWASSATSALLNISQEVTYALADRSVRLRVTLRNDTGAAITNLYYARYSDPDQAICTSPSDYTTLNDVVRQGPGATGSLVTATAAGVSVGIGSFDTRARAHVGTTDSSSAATNWSAPSDPGGTSVDTYIALIFREPRLAAGASTTFEMYYVFGTTSASAATRFDALAVPACVGEGTACTAGGVAGRCRSSACCTGCWNGVACVAGTAAATCGLNGALCATCDDGNACTNDSCSAGSCAVTPASGAFCDDGNACTTADVCTAAGTCTGSAVSCDDGLACTSDACDAASGCTSSIASGCAIDGACVASGTPSPFNVCLGCVPTISRDSWSPRSVGTACGTPVCEGGATLPAPTCDGSGTCVDGSPMACSTGRCNATADACEGELPPDMGMPDVDGGVLPMVDAGPGADGGASGVDGGGTVVPPTGGRSSRRGGCAVSASSANGASHGLLSLTLLGLAALLATKRRRR